MINPRIISGKYKKHRFKVPPNARPITDRAKMFIFDILGDLVINANILDIFAGSGSLGFEALSRGANFVLFIDSDEIAVNLIQENAFHLKIDENKFKCLKTTAKKFTKKTTKLFDLIFADPPFDNLQVFNIGEISQLLHSNALLILKWPEKSDIPTYINLEILKEKKIGGNKIIFYRKK
jgi:16S rRNA (guanine(966)-N(2))-methyltransferase RsmD